MPVNTSVDLMANGSRPLIVAAMLVDPATGAAVAPMPGGSTVTVVPVMTSGGHLSLTTSTASGTYVAFASQACKQVTVFNNTGVAIEIRQGASGVAVPLQNGQNFTFLGITNTNLLDVRRVDLSTTAVTVQARWEA